MSQLLRSPFHTYIEKMQRVTLSHWYWYEPRTVSLLLIDNITLFIVNIILSNCPISLHSPIAFTYHLGFHFQLQKPRIYEKQLRMQNDESFSIEFCHRDKIFFTCCCSCLSVHFLRLLVMHRLSYRPERCISIPIDMIIRQQTQSPENEPEFMAKQVWGSGTGQISLNWSCQGIKIIANANKGGESIGNFIERPPKKK